MVAGEGVQLGMIEQGLGIDQTLIAVVRLAFVRQAPSEGALCLGAVEEGIENGHFVGV